MDKYTNEYGRTNDPETFARFASVKSYQDYLVDKNNPVVMVTLMIDGKDFLGNAHFKTYLTQRTNDHDEFTIVVRENAIDPIKRPVMEKSGDLLGESIVIKFHQYGKVVQTYKGVITKIENYKEEGGGYGELRISGKSPTILLENGKDCQTYIEKDLPEIIKEATEEYPNFAKVYIEGGLNNSSRIPYCVQYNESDFSFISRLAKRYGEFFYYNGLQLIFGNKAQETIPLTHGAELIDVSFEVELQPQNFRYVGYDTHYNNTDQKEAKDIITQDKINPVIWDAIKGANKIYTKVPEKLASNIPTEYTSGYLNRAVKLEKEKREQMMVVKGKSRNPQMRVGVFAKLRSIYDLPMETFRVIEIKHYQEGYEYYNEFTAIPDAFIPYYYDEDSYPKALQQPARVIDNNDPEGLGRVQVQFVWQERKKEHTPWIRVVQPHAGAGKGFYFIPEIGEEVLVDFEFQNAERPYVVGAHYNGEEMSRYHTKGNDKKVIHTRSGTKIVLNDGEGSVFIEDPSGNSIYMDGKQKISFNGATLEFNAQRIVMKATESTHITTNDYILNALSKIYVFSAWFKQQITGFMQLLSNSALIKSPNTIDIEAKEAKLQGTEKSIVDSKKQAIVNSLGTAELKGKERNQFNNSAETIATSPEEELTNVIVEFRPHDGWKGEFGFDWLRINDGEGTKEVRYRDCIIDAYKETIKDGATNEETGKKEDLYLNYNNAGDAYQMLRKQYEKLTIKRDKKDKKSLSRDKIERLETDSNQYYIPWLHLYPEKETNNSKYTPAPPCEAVLSIFVDIEEEIPELLRIEFNKDFFRINDSEKPCVLNIDKNVIGIKTKIKETIKIRCIKEFSPTQEINVYAYPNSEANPAEGRLAGRLIVLPNTSKYRKKLNMFLIKVKTNITKEKIGTYDIQKEVSNLRKILYQSLVSINVINKKEDKTNKKTLSLELDLSKEDSFIHKYLVGGMIKAKENSPLYSELKKEFKNQYPIYTNYVNNDTMFVFIFGENGLSLAGATQKNGIKNVVLFERRDPFTLSHEVLHGLGLFHTHYEFPIGMGIICMETLDFKDLPDKKQKIKNCIYVKSDKSIWIFNDGYKKYPITGKERDAHENKKFVFYHGDMVPSLCTNNVMSLNRKEKYTTWRWQWEIIKRNIK